MYPWYQLVHSGWGVRGDHGHKTLTCILSSMLRKLIFLGLISFFCWFVLKAKNFLDERRKVNWQKKTKKNHLLHHNWFSIGQLGKRHVHSAGLVSDIFSVIFFFFLWVIFCSVIKLKFWVHCPIFCTTFCHWLIYIHIIWGGGTLTSSRKDWAVLYGCIK